MHDVSVNTNQPDFSAPIEDRYFEDYVPGFAQVYGSVAVTEAEILEFGRRWDPQDMHTDPEKAARGPFKGLIASGWHTSCMLMQISLRPSARAPSPIAASCGPGSRCSISTARW